MSVDDETRAWMKELVSQAVQGTGERKLFDEELIEAKAEWALPNRLLVGKVREQMNPRTFLWFVCGEIPLDYIPGENATTPREALRYFSMKWQLKAENAADEEQTNELVEHAEAIYALAEDERFWQT